MFGKQSDGISKSENLEFVEILKPPWGKEGW